MPQQSTHIRFHAEQSTRSVVFYLIFFLCARNIVNSPFGESRITCERTARVANFLLQTKNSTQSELAPKSWTTQWNTIALANRRHCSSIKVSFLNAFIFNIRFRYKFKFPLLLSTNETHLNVQLHLFLNHNGIKYVSELTVISLLFFFFSHSPELCIRYS